MVKIKANVNVSGIKRCYLEDTEPLVFKCPKCGNEMEHDFSEQYLMYPQVGTKDSITFVCYQCKPGKKGNPYGCDTEYTLPINIESVVMTITYDPKELEEYK